ncbi:MAG TPA: IPT/TIG domain-containing protein, partial [Bryobacteraceae bacterium]|nr:IPT/TIG domain-containing protein [Bryobacteraceae bacterium]
TVENPPPPALPAISGVSPGTGAVGVAVTISGSNFGASQGTSSVRFNGTTATVTGWSATSISASVPPGATTGNVIVTINGYSSNGVMFTVTVAETVSTPSIPSGPTSGLTNGNYTYTTGGSVSSLGNPVQYLFNWGDGTNSGWLPIGTTSASKAWISAGTWGITAQARSVPNPTVVSAISAPRNVSVVSGYANFSSSGSSFHTYDNWTLWLSTNVPNTWFTMCAIHNGNQSCTPNWGQTDANGNWSSASYFPPGNAGSWQEWVVFPTLGVTSNTITFSVSDYANLTISSNFHVGDSWTLTLQTSIPNTWFTICAIFPDSSQSCTPNWAQTDAYGNWTSTGSFSEYDVGSWQEWIVFPTATSNSINFTVSP